MYSYRSRVDFFCFKQKTAYEMRISDWSSDVCSSDLSFGKRLDPMPTQVAPALNHFARFSAVGSTPPVTMMLVQGMGPLIALMKPGPNTLAGKSLTTSAPSSRSEEHTSELQSLMRISYAVFCLIKK